MTTFLLIAGAATTLALLLLLVPLLRRRQRPPLDDDTREHDIRIARERLEELRREHERGELSDEEFEQARTDLQIALARDLDTGAPPRTAAARGVPNWLTAALVAVLVPALAAGVYLATGSPQLIDPPARVATPGDGHLPGTLDELVTRLERQMEQRPDDPRGWFLLGRSYMTLERHDDAVRAFERLERLLPDNPTVLISLADALSMQQGGRVPDAAVERLDRVLEIDPRNPTALWLRGNAAGQRGQDAEALDFWSRAWPLLAGEPAMQRELEGMIRAVERRSGLRANLPETLPAIAGGTQAPPAEAPGDGPALRVEVALDAELLDRAAPDDPVFVYAKAVSGPPMPLAVVRKRVSDLPLEVVLDDRMAMTPQMRLSGFPRVKVGARVSKSGRPVPAPGDLQSTEVEVATDHKAPVRLVIDRVR